MKRLFLIVPLLLSRSRGESEAELPGDRVDLQHALQGNRGPRLQSAMWPGLLGIPGELGPAWREVMN